MAFTNAPLMGSGVVPSKLHGEVVTSVVTTFGDTAFMEIDVK